MYPKIPYRFLALMMILSLSCNFFTGLIPSGEISRPGTPLDAKGHGPAGLTAEATSADSVKLTWQPVDGATSYHISVSTAGDVAFPVMDLTSSATSYEDFMAMPGSQLRYAVEALSDSGSIGQSIVDVTTPARAPNPLTVNAQLNAQENASAKIDSSGGNISLADQNGVKYELDIPAGALDASTDITLTAVKNINGWPLDGNMLGAVKIEPDGLVLNSMATLSITLPANQPSINLSNIGFAFSGSGSEFHLKPVYDKKLESGLIPVMPSGGHLSSLAKQDGATIVMETLVMYGIGVGEGSSDSAGKLTKYHAPVDTGSALDQKQATAQLIPDANLSKYHADLEDVKIYIYAEAVYNSIAMTENCDQLKKAVSNMDSFGVRSNTALVRGAARPELIKAEEQALWDKLTDKIMDVVDKASSDCEKKPQDKTRATAEAGCLESLISKIAEAPSPFYVTLQNKLRSKFGDTAITNADDKLAKCLPSYQASGGSNGYGFSGTICSLRQPFILTASGMEQFSVQFTPSSVLSGNVVAAGGGGPCTDGGSGAYIVNLSTDGSGNIIAKFPASTVKCPGVSKTNEVVQVVTITPLAEKPASCGQ